MSDCDIDPSSLRCRVCGASVSAPHVRRNCGTAPHPGLGDLVKSGLSAIGITEERVSKAIGRPCGCGERAEMLNAVGAKYLGLSPGSTAPENNG
jgi:hypothetical protein